jgi:hypothetical protein
LGTTPPGADAAIDAVGAVDTGFCCAKLTPVPEPNEAVRTALEAIPYDRPLAVLDLNVRPIDRVPVAAVDGAEAVAAAMAAAEAGLVVGA